VKQKVLDRLDPPRKFPNIGEARLRTQHWECIAYYTDIVELAWPVKTQLRKSRVNVVDIDNNILETVAGARINVGR
jgi:hypothetical protein